VSYEAIWGVLRRREQHHFIIQTSKPVVFLDHTGWSKQGIQQEQQHVAFLADRQEQWHTSVTVSDSIIIGSADPGDAVKSVSYYRQSATTVIQLLPSVSYYRQSATTNR